MTTSATAPARRERRRLVGPGWRQLAIVAMALAAGGLMGLGLTVHRTGSGTRLDQAIKVRIAANAGATVRQLTIDLVQPPLVVSVLVLAALVAVAMRRWDVVALAVVGPALAFVTTETVLKPLVHRTFSRVPVPGIPAASEGAYAFPSGHETVLASVMMVLVVICLGASVPLALRLAGVAVLALWTAGGAIGLISNNYHYPTDALGGLCVAVLVVMGVAFVIDAVSGLSSPAGRGPASTTP